MKSNIFLAGLVLLCAVHANTATPIPEENALIQESFGLKELVKALKQIAQNLEKEIKSAIEQPHTDFSTKVDSVLEALLESTKEAMEELQKLSDEVMQEHIDNLPDKQLAKCIVKFEPQVREISQENLKELLACGKVAKEDIVKSAVKVDELLKKVKQLRDELVSGVTECVEESKGTIEESMQCVGKKVTKITQQLSQNVRELLKVIAKETVQVVKIYRNAKECGANVLKHTNEKLVKISEEVKECQAAENLLY